MSDPRPTSRTERPEPTGPTGPTGPIVPMPAPGASTAADLIDWRAVERLSALVPPGPVVTRASRSGVVAVLRRSARESPAWIAEITGMRRAAGVAAARTDLRVVDRAGLIRASAGDLRILMGSVPAPEAGQAARLAAGAEAASALGVVSTRLLGQVLPRIGSLGGPVDDGARSGPAPGERPSTGGGRQVQGASDEDAPTARLLLVAPNVLEMRRRLDLDLLDLPAWVALHETTHAVQLAAAPWLVGYLTSRMRALIHGVVTTVYGPDRHEPSRRRRLRGVHLGAVLAGRGPALEDLVDRRERTALADLASTLTFLEGHAEAVLDSVGPRRMPSVHRLRAILSRTRGGERGAGPGPGSGSILHRLVSLDAKESQYADGAAFVRAVVARVGHEGLNRVWSAPERLPTAAEIAQPDLWLERMEQCRSR